MAIQSSSNSLGSSAAGTSGSSQAAAQAAAKLGRVTQTTYNASTKLQSQLDATSAQLSAFGKIKSAVSDAQLAAKSLSGLGNTASASEVKSALTRLVSSYNTALSTAQAGTSVAGASAKEVSNAKRVGNDLTRAVAFNYGTLDALKKIGVQQQRDGTLRVDTSAFDAAQKANPSGVQATLAQLGTAVDKTTSQELTTGSALSGSIEALTLRSATLKTQQSAMSSLLNHMLSASSSGSTTGSYANYGIAAYQANR